MIVRTKEVKNILAQVSPDMIEISDRLTLLFLARWALRAGFKTTLFAHERVDGVLTAFFGNRIPALKIADFWNRLTSKGVNNFVATTQYAAIEYKRVGIDAKIIPLGVDIGRFSTSYRSDLVRKEYQIDETLIIAMTRLSKEKDPIFLIEIARELKIQQAPGKLVVLGEGPLRKSLEKIAVEENLPIKFVGHVSDRSRVSILLASADVFVAVGPIETFGLAALEALASGTPVICRDSGAISEVIDMHCGSSEVRDAKAWVSHIEHWSNKNRMVTSSVARNRAEQFSWHFCANSLLDLYGLTSPDRKVA